MAEYKYRCPRCGSVLTFDRPKGGLKCPSCGFMMVKM